MKINIIAPKGPFTFARLVTESFTHAGYEVHGWDYRRERNPTALLDRDAPTIVLRGEAIDSISHVLQWLNGPRYLWYAEDCYANKGRELLDLAAYYDDIWLHWRNQDAIDAILAQMPRKRIQVAPVLYADQSIWNPDTSKDGENPTACDVLHYGGMTPRREAILNELRRRLRPQGISILQVEDHDHRRIAKLCRHAKVVLNLHAWSPVNVEVRIAEAMSCGAFVVSEKLPTCEMKFYNNLTRVLDTDSIDGIVNSLGASAEARRALDAEPVTEFSHLNIARDIAPLMGLPCSS